MTTEQECRRQIIEIGRRMYDKGFVAATDGNISVRLDENRILTTPNGISKGFMREDDLIVLAPDGRKLSGNRDQSSEFRMHLKVYELRPDVCAVIHAHPPVATALSIAGVSLAQPVIPEVIISFGEIPTVPYATPTTEEVPQVIAGLIKDHDALILERHGTLTIGNTIESAYFKLEKIEHAAQVIFIASQAGTIRTLSPDQVNKLLAIRVRYFQKPPDPR